MLRLNKLDERGRHGRRNKILHEMLIYPAKSAAYVYCCMNSMHETDLCGKAAVSVLPSKRMSF